MSMRAALAFPNALQQADINFSSSGDNIIVLGVVLRQIKVFRLKLLCAGATAVALKDGVGIVLDGPLSFAANQGMILDFTSIDMPPWYTTSYGNSFVINSTNAVQIGGSLDYSVAT